MLEWYQRVEHSLQKKLEEYPIADKSAVLSLVFAYFIFQQERVSEAVRIAHMQIKEDQANEKT